MPWTAPFTFSGVTTAAQINEVRTNLLFLYNPPSCMTLRTTTLTLASSSGLSDVGMNSEVWDNDTIHASSNAFHTLQTAGRYLWVASLGFVPSAAGRRWIQVTLNNASSIHIVAWLAAPPSAVSGALSLSGVRARAASDTATLQASQQSGGNLDIWANTANLLSHWIGNP